MTIATGYMQPGFTPYSTLNGVGLGEPPTWYPQEAATRVAAYFKYDELYWNDPTQYELRVLEEEEPIYIPTSRVIVDTTAHYLLKGLQITVENADQHKATTAALKNLLAREMFYSRFHTAKHSGVARGDWVFHMTADGSKGDGEKISLNYVDPAMVIPVCDPEDPEEVIRVHLVDQFKDEADQTRTLVKKLTYEYVIVGGRRRVKRSEGLYEVTPAWWGPRPELVKVTLPEALLPPEITHIPIYWFKNQDWMGQEFGSSELRGLESIIQAVSQAATDQGSALGLEGLGVYATDSGRPVDDEGNEVDWEISPGRVMEVAAGNYFRRVEGLSTLKPSMDHITMLEERIQAATALSDVALGRVDVQTAQSGIALAIKFMPTLAKLEQRDEAGKDKLRQLFHDWQIWHEVFEGVELTGEIEPKLGRKLPADRTAVLNELNNMLDRSVISRQYYRQECAQLGYVFPEDIEEQIEAEKTKDAERAAQFAPPGLQENAGQAARGERPPPQSAGGAQNAPREGENRSNNRNRPNESGGTEASQSVARQARGGTPRR
jgi:hypothetical protein